MGATTVLMAACFDFPANVRAIIADCGFTSPYAIAKSVLHRDYPRLPVGLLLPICGLFTRLFAGFGLHDASTLDAVRESRYPILFIHGTGDTFVPSRDDERGLCRLHVRKRADLSGQRGTRKELSGGTSRVEEALCRFLATHTESKEEFPMTQHEITKAAPLLDAAAISPNPAGRAPCSRSTAAPRSARRKRASRNGTITASQTGTSGSRLRLRTTAIWG